MIAVLLATAMLPADESAGRRSSLIGDWAYVDPHRDASLPVEPCETDNGVRYERGGRFSTFMGDVRGRWRVRGRSLWERVTQEEDDATGRVTAVRAGETRSVVRWLSPDHVNIVVAPGEVQGLVRCPAASRR